MSTSQINLAWTDTADEAGYRIERCTGAGCDGFAPIATVPAGATTYNDTGLMANTSYTYRLLAYNSAGGSGYS